MKMRINTQSMQFSRYMVSITIFIISLYRRSSKDASGLGFMSSSDIRGQQDLFQVAGNGRVSGFGKGGGNLIPVHLERGGISWHTVTSSTERKSSKFPFPPCPVGKYQKAAPAGAAL